MDPETVYAKPLAGFELITWIINTQVYEMLNSFV